jgi:hypothetical protein
MKTEIGVTCQCSGNLHLRRSASRGDAHNSGATLQTKTSDAEAENQNPFKTSSCPILETLPEQKKSRQFKLQEQSILTINVSAANKGAGKGLGHASGDSECPKKIPLSTKSEGGRGHGRGHQELVEREGKKMRAGRTVVEILDDSDVSDDFQ